MTNGQKRAAQRDTARHVALKVIMSEGNAARGCGPCTACCTTTEVEGLKPADEACVHLRADGGGCGIHESKPDLCARWLCGWRMGLGDDDERPDLVGYVLEPSRFNGARGRAPLSLSPREAVRHLWFYAHDAVPGAGLAALRRLAEVADLGAIEVEVQRFADGRGAFQCVGPEAALMTFVALYDRAGCPPAPLPFPLWITPESQRAAEALLGRMYGSDEHAAARDAATWWASVDAHTLAAYAERVGPVPPEDVA